MLSSLEASRNNIPSTPLSFTGSMSALLFDDSMEQMDVDKSSSEALTYMREYIDSSFSFSETTSSFSASPCSDHTTISRTSSDEGCSNSVTSSYTLPTCSDVFSPTLSNGNKFQMDSSKADTSSDDFPYEDVLSLETALEEAVGDSLGDIESVQNEGIQCTSSSNTPMPQQTFSFPEVPKSIPPIRNLFPKVSHRVVISPTTTLVLSDDIKRKKHRPVSITSMSSAEFIKETSLVQSRAMSSSASNSAKVTHPSTRGIPSTTIKQKTLQSYSSNEKEVRSSEYSTVVMRSCSDSHVTDPTMKNLEYSTSEDSAFEDQITSTSNDEESSSKKIVQALQKHPLPPEGYKITRYPLKTQAGAEDEKKTHDEMNQTDVITELRHQLQKARMEVDHRLKEVEEWKISAQQTFDAARKIRAQMELEKSRADRAESKIAQLTAHFRSKAVAKARAKSLGAEKTGSCNLPTQTTKSPSTSDGVTSKKTGSPDPIILGRKRRRTVPELDEVTKSLASWLMSQPSDTVSKKKSAITITKSVSESVFGNTKQKDDLVYSPQINSGVRLALRAKVCSARADTLNTAQDLIKQTKMLVADLPTIPESPGITIPSELLESKMSKRNRWSSVDSVHAMASPTSTATSTRSTRVTMSHSLSESSISSKKT